MSQGFRDSSVVVRYLSGTPPEMAARAARIINGETGLVLTDGVLAEVAYALMGQYGVARAVIVDNLSALVRRDNVTVWRLEKDIVLQALRFCRPSGRVSFDDALLWAVTRSSADAIVYSFDKRFPKDGIDVRTEP